MKINGVAEAKIVTPEEAYNIMKEEIGEKVLEGYEPDIFPYAYMVTLTDLDLNDSVREQITKIENVDDMPESSTISRLATIGKGVRAVTGVILVILILISVFIISYTIKLTVYARRREISIMKYVGATNGFIRGPFIVEGIIIGVVSALITLAIVGLAYNSAVNVYNTKIETIPTNIIANIFHFEKSEYYV